MSLGSFIRKQFIDILQWNEDRDGVLAWRHPMQDFEIQYGASLTVRESQMAVFVNEGKVADVFGPGMYKLTTQTLPILTYLKNWDKLFESPFKSDVIFFSTRLQLGRRWGTAQPVTLRDSEFGMVRLRAFGVYSYQIADPGTFYREVSGTRDVHGGRPGIAAAQHGGRRNDHGAGRLQGAVPGHGRQPGPDVAEHQRAAGADLRALRRQVGQLHRRERVAAGRAAEGAGHADFHGHGRRPGQVHPVPDGHGHSDGGAERRRHRRHRRRPRARRWARPWRRGWARRRQGRPPSLPRSRRRPPSIRCRSCSSSRTCSTRA